MDGQPGGGGIDIHVSKAGGEIQLTIQAFDHFLAFCRAIFDDWLIWGSSHPILFTISIIGLLVALWIFGRTSVDMRRMKHEFGKGRRNATVQLSLRLPSPHNDDSSEKRGEG